MTAQEPISKSLHDAHCAALNEVNRWRGSCVDKYSRAEAALRKAIKVILAHSDGAALKQPSLFGQHVEVMTAAIAADGPFGQSGSKARDALASCSEGFALRNIITHAVGTVWLDRREKWLWRYEFQPSGKGKALVIGSLKQKDALKVEQDLRSSVHSLEEHLENLIGSLLPPQAR